MKKSTIIAILLGTTIMTTPVLSTFYADSVLIKNYKRAFFGQLNHKKVIEQDMNFFGGHIKWTAEFSDHCKNNSALTIFGNDTIKKTWFGYDIQSEISVDWSKMPKLTEQQKQELSNWFKLNLQHQVNWMGDIHTSTTLPRIEHTKNNASIIIEPIHSSFDIFKHKGRYAVKNVNLNIPLVYFKVDNQVLLHIKNAYSIDEQKGDYLLTSAGTNKAHIEHFELNLTPIYKTHIMLKDLTLMNTTTEHKDTVDFDMSIHAQSIQLKQPNKFMDIQPIKLNLQAKDMHKVSIQNYFDTISSPNYECLSQSTLDKINQEHVKSTINHGFHLISKDNQIIINQQPAFKMDIDYKVKANQATSEQQFADALSKYAQYHVDIQIDKSVIEAVVALVKPSETTNQALINELSKNLAQTLNAQIQGQSIISKKSNP